MFSYLRQRGGKIKMFILYLFWMTAGHDLMTMEAFREADEERGDDHTWSNPN